MIKSIYRDDSGYIWMGAYAIGIIRWRPGRPHSEVLPVSAYNRDSYCTAIMKDSCGRMVMAVDNNVIWTDRAGRKIAEVTLAPMARRVVGNPVIYAIVEWKKDHYLVGTSIGLYDVAFPAAGRHEAVKYLNDGKMYGWVYGFYKDAGGDIYVAKRNGYNKLRLREGGRPELLEAGLDGLPVRHFYESVTSPLLWLATEQGLLAYNRKLHRYTVFDEQGGIANSYIYAILPQDDTTLWVSTNKGISRVAVQYSADKGVTAKFRNYTAKDGLQSNEFNTGAFHKCSDGTLMFGGIAGINWFKPGDIVPNPYKPLPAITSIYVDDTLMASDTAMYIKELRMPYDRNTISFTMRALEYTLPEQNMYAYKLEGLDKDWVYTTTDRARYSNLPPGAYRFLLRVRNNEAVWNDEPLALSVVILPPFWQTWWFRSLLVITALACGYLGVRLYARRKVLAKTRELEQLHMLNLERIRISRDVHDDIGSGLSRISLLSELANQKILQNQAPVHDVSNISAISKDLVDNMRDLIWLLNPENTTLDSLAARIREYSADYLDGMNVAVLFNFPATVPPIEVSRDVQRSVLLTVKEAINNAIKHAHATMVTIDLSVTGAYFTVAVSDNGHGFDVAATSAKGNGLRNMKHRLEAIGGTCSITSVPAHGTKVQMVVPVSKLVGAV